MLCLLFLFALSSLSASKLVWSWRESDENIKYYRYQLGGENEDGWTTVERQTTSVTLDSDITTLYLQSSYDGINWSPSSKGTYSNIEEAAETKEEDNIGYITLSWDNDNNYNYFRYRRDINSTDEWTEVTGDTTSVLLPYHKGLNTYYIQSSWDGSLWSESAEETYIYEDEEKKSNNEVEKPLSLRLNIAPFSAAVYYFYNGHYIDNARTLMGTIYGVSTSIELDWTPLSFLRIYPEFGYAYEMKIQTVIPKKQDMHYIKGGLGADYLLSISERSNLYIGALGGAMAHINNSKYNIAPYFGMRLGFETKLSDSFTLGAFSRVTASFLTVADDSLYNSVTLLIDPVSLTLSYCF